MTDPVSVIVPARNEAETIGKVVSVLFEMADVGEVVVIDNGSDDETAAEARAAGARVVSEPRAGMGHAVRTGIAATRYDWVMKVDADLDKFDTDLFARMPAARGPGVGLVKGAWHDPGDNMPMTRLLVMPAICLMFPGLGHLRAPNSGLYLFNKSLIAQDALVGDYAVDLDVMLRVHAAGAKVAEVDIGRIEHDVRDVPHYNAMAEMLLKFVLSRQNRHLTTEVVMMAQDAAEVIRHALGTLAAKAVAGGRVTIYLAQDQGPDAEVLRAVMAPYPTAQVLPLAGATGFAPGANATGICVLAPFPQAGESEVLDAAIALHNGVGDLASELLLVPIQKAGRVIAGFRPDTVTENEDGLEIKREALNRLEGMAVESTPQREMFQSYASLPEALRPGFQSVEKRPSAG
ncbi:Glucosyl-3-phosphoglycerate synthase [Roseovarius gaetbuli]|uniref:Glucosyl-3-phosphoglycerate synthase n=1 Tax=Roseovarius gaetbuli TaxID=1356575 RepID=A0A1X6ZBI2_9RHOB|nr:glycosyltransferase [Roseovarius gaetbuli]SLN46783.1 Glucosyl-3-phosphoglycerate synthase [Roseovarius gaetbuli]